MTEEEKWEEEFERWVLPSHTGEQNRLMRAAYLQACKVRQEEIEKLEFERPIIPLVYCKEHKTICMPFCGKLACCLQSSLESKETEIEKLKKDKEKLIDLISESGPLAWIAHHNMEAAHEWEKKAFELIGGNPK